MGRYPLICLLLLVLAASCVRNEFDVEFSLTRSVSESYTMLYYASDSRKGWLVDEVAVVTHGQGAMKGATRNPTLIYVFQGGMEPSLVIYAERGDKITVEGDAAPASWDVAGNKINEQLTQWRRENRDILSARNNGKINAAVERFVKTSPDNPVSALILLFYYDRSENQQGFDRLMKTLKGKAADRKWLDMAGRNDLLAGHAPLAVRSEPLILRTAGSGCDTLTTDEQPMLIYFSNNSADGRASDIMELKKLVKERTDSGKPQIVNVSMENDSTSWNFQMRRDTLKGVVQAWMPLSFSDPQAAGLGVSRIPCVIVADKGGRILYRGQSMNEGARILRTKIKK